MTAALHPGAFLDAFAGHADRAGIDIMSDPMALADLADAIDLLDMAGEPLGPHTLLRHWDDGAYFSMLLGRIDKQGQERVERYLDAFTYQSPQVLAARHAPLRAVCTRWILDEASVLTIAPTDATELHTRLHAPRRG